MIVMGSSRGGAAALGNYLESVGENERIALVEVRGTVAQDVKGALKEMEAYAEGTKCQKPLYHAMVCPQPGYKLTPEQFLEAVDILEKELGLEGQPRVIVAHEKHGEEHRHVAWSRIDLNTLTAVPDSHNYAKHERAAREMERVFGHPHVQGAHAKRENVERPDRSPTRPELRQEELTGIKSKDVREEVTALFRASSDAAAFKESLEAHGYLLAKGDRRDFVLVDRAGGDHSLARRISGMKAAELREFMAPIDRSSLPTVEDAIQIAHDRMRGGSDFDLKCWEDALAANAIVKEIEADRARDSNIAAVRQSDREHDVAGATSRKWEDALSANAVAKAASEEEEQALRRQLAREARQDALIVANYAKGDDYVTQTQAALKEHARRQDAVDADPDEPRPRHPEEKTPEELRMERMLDDDRRDKRRAEDEATGREASRERNNDRIASNFDRVEMNDAARQGMRRMLDDGDDGHDDDLEPDRQPQAPGGGRTRSR